MNLIEIKINNYKAIKKPITISISKDNKLVTFIGKNGSGKSTVLEAIRLLSHIKIEHNYVRYMTRDNLDIEYKLLITDEEKEEYFGFDLPVDCNEITIKINEHFDYPQINSNPFRFSLKKFYKEFKNCYNAYKQAINELQEEINNLSYSEETRNTIMEHVYHRKEFSFDANIEKLDKLLELTSKDYFDFARGDYIGRYDSLISIKINEILPFRNNYFNSMFIEANGLTEEKLTEMFDKYDDFIKEINSKIKEKLDKVNAIINKYNILIDKISKIFDLAKEKYEDFCDRNNAKHESFVKTIVDAIHRNCHYLDNESSLLFYDNKNENFYGNNYRDSNNTILKAIDNFLIKNNYYKNKESILERKNISKERLIELQDIINNKFLANIISKTDESEVKGYYVDIQNKFEFYVIEKTGEKVNFNETSLGRRWYLTFSFVKNILKPGDFFIIDEPAAFLHPQAQLEFKEELKALTKEGIYIFISTHSPYMIDDNWENVYDVYISEDGIKLKSFSEKNQLSASIMEELGILRTSDILFNLSKTILLLEGRVDKICIEKFSKLLNYDISDYHIVVANGSNILGLTYLCINETLKFKALFDYDTKNKPEEWLKSQYGYKEYLDIIENNKNCIFTKPNNNYESIEAYFSKEDCEKYFKNIIKDKKNGKKEEIKKVDDKKIEKATEFTSETLKNFEQLFIELGFKKLTNE